MSEAANQAARATERHVESHATGQAVSAATQRLNHSRERIRRYLVRSQAAEPQRQQAARNKRHMWLGAALAVALLIAWQQPWRRSSGLARALALVVAGLKVPGMLHTLAGQIQSVMSWWRTFSLARATAKTAWNSGESANAGEPSDKPQGHAWPDPQTRVQTPESADPQVTPRSQHPGVPSSQPAAPAHSTAKQ